MGSILENTFMYFCWLAYNNVFLMEMKRNSVYTTGCLRVCWEKNLRKILENLGPQFLWIFSFLLHLHNELKCGGRKNFKKVDFSLPNWTFFHVSAHCDFVVISVVKPFCLFILTQRQWQGQTYCKIGFIAACTKTS